MVRYVALLLLFLQSPARKAETGVVTGQLLRTDGKPAVGVRIAVTPVPETKDAIPTGDLLSLASTDGSGNYRLEDILPGRYYIQAGLLDIPNYYPGTSSLDKATVITVGAGEVVHADTFKMVRPPGIRIYGQLPPEPSIQRMIVLGTDSGPAPSQMLVPSSSMPGTVTINMAGGFIFQTSGGPNGQVIRMVGGPSFFGAMNTPSTVNADGTFEILGVRPGRYSVLMMPRAIQATIVAGEEDVEIRMPDYPGVKVSGFFGLTEGSRAANQKIMLSGPIWGRLDTVTDDNGAFSFPNVPSGTYTLRSADGLSLSTIKVTDKELSGVTVAAIQVIPGVIYVEDGNAPNAVPPLLMATKTDGTRVPLPIPRGPFTVFADGGTGTTFQLRLAEGEYRIAVNNLISPFVVKSMTCGPVDLMKDPLIVPAAGQEIHITIGKNP